MSCVYEFGPFRMDVGQRVLLRDGKPVPLKPKAFDLLVELVEHRDRIVGKEELMRHVWPDSAVEDNNLTVQKSALVAVLGDGYIQTVPRRGYRFVAEVTCVTGGSDGAGQAEHVNQPGFAEGESRQHPGGPVPTSASGLAAPGGAPAGGPKVRPSRLTLVASVALITLGSAALIWYLLATRAEPLPGERTLVRSPSDEQEVMRVVKESQIYETLQIYTRPEAFDRSQLSRYWMSVEQGGQAVPAIEAAVGRLLKRGWRYADESRLEVFDFRHVRIFSPRDYAEVGTSERWYVPTVRADGSRVENRNVYLGVYDVDYTLRKIDGRWLIEENSTPRPRSDGGQNK